MNFLKRWFGKKKKQAPLTQSSGVVNSSDGNVVVVGSDPFGDVTVAYPAHLVPPGIDAPTAEYPTSSVFHEAAQQSSHDHGSAYDSSSDSSDDGSSDGGSSD